MSRVRSQIVLGAVHDVHHGHPLAVRPDAGIVERVVEPAVAAHAFLHQRLHVGLVRHVALHERGVAALVGDEIAGLFAALAIGVGGDDDLRPFACEELRARPADAGSAPGDQCYLAAES